MHIPRRNFLKLVTFGTATSIVAGKLWQREVMAYCTNSSEQKDAVFKVRLSDFPALQSEYGSVRLAIIPVISPEPDGPGEPVADPRFYPIVITRDGFGTFYVLDSECRHAKWIVPKYDSGEFLIRCEHGSCYDVEGNVLQGPAMQPLYRHEFSFDGVDTLTIKMPCWGFTTQATVLPGGATSRLRLDFDAVFQVTYEISFAQSPNGPWTTASFATTPTGPADQTSLTLADSGPASVYLDRTTSTGFYAVGMKLIET